MDCSTVTLLQEPSENWCNSANGGRVQQRWSRNRHRTRKGWTAAVVANIATPALSNSFGQAACTRTNTNTTEEVNGAWYSTGACVMRPTSWAEFEEYQVVADASLERIDASAVIGNAEYCNTIIEKLGQGNEADKHQILVQLHPFLRQLALSRCGCRVVQKALEVAGGCNRDLIIAALKDYIIELYESPHGNHVLSRAIEVLPSSKIYFVICALLGRGLAVSRHRFGCRIVCRLIEHCGEDMIGELLDEVLAETDMLARHQFGNFVVQTAMEHTTLARRSAMLSQLLPGFATLAIHRTGSLVAQRVFDYCDEADQQLAIQALLQGLDGVSIVDAACHRYGSYVIEQLSGLHGAAKNDVVRALACHSQQIMDSEHGRKVVLAFGLFCTEELATSAEGDV